MIDSEVIFRVLKLLSDRHSMNFFQIMIPLRMENDPRRLKNILDGMASEGYIKEISSPAGQTSYSLEQKGMKLLADKKV